MSEHEHSGLRFWVGFFVGGLIGAIVLFFLGTKEGRKTGKTLQSKGDDVLDELRIRLDEMVQEGKSLVKEGKEIKEEVIEKLEDKKESLTKSASESIDSALAHIEALQERGRQTTATLRKQFKNLPKKS